MATVPTVSAAATDRLKIDYVRSHQNLAETAAVRARSLFRRYAFRLVARDVVRHLESGDRAALAASMAGWRARATRFLTVSSAAMTKATDGVRIVPSRDKDVSLDWIESAGFESEGVCVYVPGGSFVVGLTPRLTAMIARIAKAARTRTCIVQYRLAPESPCPAAIDDVVHAVQALIAQGTSQQRIVVLAESAGAAVALAAVQRLRDDGVALAGVCLLSPWVDLALTGLSLVTKSLKGGSETRMEFPAICVHLYLQGRSPFDPVASPIYGDLSGLPPLLVHTSRGDAFHDDARKLAQRAFEAGGDTMLRVWPHAEHVIEQGFGPRSERAIADAGAFIRARLNA